MALCGWPAPVLSPPPLELHFQACSETLTDAVKAPGFRGSSRKNVTMSGENAQHAGGYHDQGEGTVAAKSTATAGKWPEESSQSK